MPLIGTQTVSWWTDKCTELQRVRWDDCSSWWGLL